jgi:hypothetical protein
VITKKQGMVDSDVRENSMIIVRIVFKEVTGTFDEEICFALIVRGMFSLDANIFDIFGH